MACVQVGALGLTVACKEPIDPSSLSVSIEGYESWDKVEPLLGAVPGHGDTYRVMFRNEAARSYTGAGDYPLGSAIVKEIYKLQGTDGKGALLYKAIMRRIDEDADLPITGGWLFTQAGSGSDSGSEEFQRDLCWDSCHKAAPYVGAFFDHSF